MARVVRGAAFWVVNFHLFVQGNFTTSSAIVSSPTSHFLASFLTVHITYSFSLNRLFTAIDLQCVFTADLHIVPAAY